jgi:hypothetical protein
MSKNITTFYKFLFLHTDERSTVQTPQNYGSLESNRNSLALTLTYTFDSISLTHIQPKQHFVPTVPPLTD